MLFVHRRQSQPKADAPRIKKAAAPRVDATRLPRTVLAGLALAWAIATIGCAGGGVPWSPKPGQPAEHVIVYRDHYHGTLGLPGGAKGIEEWAYGERVWIVDERDQGDFYNRQSVAASSGALRALFWPNRGVVELTEGGPAYDARNSTGTLTTWRIPITPEGLAVMRRFLDASIQSRQAILVDGCQSYYPSAARYHVFNNCNHYIAEALRAGGVPIHPSWCLLPAGLWMQLGGVADQTSKRPAARLEKTPGLRTKSF
jgi:hypothetical protein